MSPYLLQHADNPVNWYPWGEEAFRRARAEDKPVFLSIGYSTCHWCHVMEKESFEKEDVADILNEHYVAIKVDREERPDVDSAYMTATQLATGRGGWPNSLWLTPEGKPWFAGTYFPKEDVGSRAGFKTLLLELAELWNDRREEVEGRAEQLSHAIERVGSVRRIQGDGRLSVELCSELRRALRDAFDARFGGFGPAPKFPPHQALRFLLYRLQSEKDPGTLEMATTTLNAMALGGMRDHLGGGFHRYSTDRRWMLPHFEKMLYDNAQLALNYADAFLLTGATEYERVARETLEWALREMRDEAGGFFSAVDADSEGQEGRFYLWSRDEVEALLGQEEGALFLAVYGASGEGNYEEEAGGGKTGLNVLHLPHPIEKAAEKQGLSAAELEERLRTARRTLLESRNRRVRPHVDDKVIVSWNGLMIESLAYAGRALQEPRYVEAADRAARFILDTMSSEGRLKRSYRKGAVKGMAFADDYAFFVKGLLALYEVRSDSFYLERAKEFMDSFVEGYYDEDAGGFFLSPHGHKHMVFRSKEAHDAATPAANGIAAQDLLLLYKHADDDRYLALMRGCLGAFSSAMARSPRGSETLILSWAQYLDTVDKEEREEPDCAAAEGPVTVKAYASSLHVAQGESFQVSLRLRLEEGWHVYAHEPVPESLVPTSIAVEKGEGFALRDVSYPAGERISLGPQQDALPLYSGAVSFLLSFTVEERAPEGPSQLVLSFLCQPCDDRRCLSPTALTLSLPFVVGTSGH